MNDLELWQKIQMGNELAFQNLFDLYHSEMVNRAYYYVSDVEIAKDITQDLWVKIWKQRNQLEIRGGMRAYLLQATRNSSLNFLKKKRHLTFDEHFEREDASAGAQENLQMTDLEILIHSAVQKMPDACRAIFLLRRTEELSLKEIAQQLEISPKTVENQLTKARKIVAKYLQPFLLLCWFILTKHLET